LTTFIVRDAQFSNAGLIEALGYVGSVAKNSPVRKIKS